MNTLSHACIVLYCLKGKPWKTATDYSLDGFTAHGTRAMESDRIGVKDAESIQSLESLEDCQGLKQCQGTPDPAILFKNLAHRSMKAQEAQELQTSSCSWATPSSSALSTSVATCFVSWIDFPKALQDKLEMVRSADVWNWPLTLLTSGQSSHGLHHTNQQWRFTVGVADLWAVWKQILVKSMWEP